MIRQGLDMEAASSRWLGAGQVVYRDRLAAPAAARCSLPLLRLCVKAAIRKLLRPEYRLGDGTQKNSLGWLNEWRNIGA
jgi:hypothetical protein